MSGDETARGVPEHLEEWCPCMDSARLNVERLAEALQAWAGGFWGDATPQAAERIAAEYARLSVADGPGPEERLIRSDRFRVAVRQVFEAPGDFGPAQRYYGGDIDHFIDMLVAALPENREEPSG